MSLEFPSECPKLNFHCTEIRFTKLQRKKHLVGVSSNNRIIHSGPSNKGLQYGATDHNIGSFPERK